MSKKILQILGFIIIFPMLTSLVACLGSPKSLIAEEIEERSQDETNEEEEITEEVTEEVEEIITAEPEVVVTEEPTVATEEVQQDITLVKYSWYQEEDIVFAGYIFKNPNMSYVVEEASFNFSILDANGLELGYDWYDLSQIQPEQEFAVAFTYYLSDETDIVDSISVDWDTTFTQELNDVANPLTINQVNYWPNDGYPGVTGSIINDSEFIYKYIEYSILCFDNTGEIVGGNHDYVEFIPEFSEVGFSSYIDTYGEVAETRIYLELSPSTEIIENSNIWTDLSVVDDHLYQDIYGWVYGGAVISNNTSSPIENSLLFATLYDSTGRVISTADAYVEFIFPGDSAGLPLWSYFIPDDAIISHYDIWVLPGEKLTNYEVSTNPFVVTNLGIVGDYNSTISVTFSNTYNKQVSEVDVYVLLRNNYGEIIGGGYDWTSEATPAGGSSTVEVWVSYDSDEEIDSIEAWILPNYWTTFD
jgi:hypothetical protein